MYCIVWYSVRIACCGLWDGATFCSNATDTVCMVCWGVMGRMIFFHTRLKKSGLGIVCCGVWVVASVYVLSGILYV